MVRIRVKIIFCAFIIFLFFPVIINAATDNNSRARVIAETLNLVEGNAQSSSPETLEDDSFPRAARDLNLRFAQNKNQPSPTSSSTFAGESTHQSQIGLKAKKIKTEAQRNEKADAQWLKSGDFYSTVGARIGYITGMTSYDFDHHTSELEYPMDNWLVGGDVGVGYKRLSLTGQIWTNFTRDIGWNMEDKDWDGGDLVSYTKSDTKTDIFLWDIAGRFDFIKATLSSDIDSLILYKGDTLRIGVLGGYAQHRFDFDMYGVEYVGWGREDEGERVLTYKVKYSIPYIGLALDAESKKVGMNMSLKYGLHPTASDLDGHIARNLFFYGDYDKHGRAWMGSMSGFYKVNDGWRLQGGVDGTFIRIDGRTWDTSHNPVWDKDQSTDAYYWLIWTELLYKF